MRLTKTVIPPPALLTERQAFILECIFKIQTMCDGIKANTSNKEVMESIRKETTLNASASQSNALIHQQVDDMLYSQCSNVMDHLCDTLNAWASLDNQSCTGSDTGIKPEVH